MDGIRIREEIWARTIRTLSTRVRFDFGCQEEPEFTLIARKGRYPSEVGVKACGKTGTYLRGHRNLWILGKPAGHTVQGD